VDRSERLRATAANHASFSFNVALKIVAATRRTRIDPTASETFVPRTAGSAERSARPGKSARKLSGGGSETTPCTSATGVEGGVGVVVGMAVGEGVAVGSMVAVASATNGTAVGG
jgi:hypothetical protein